MPAVFQHGDLGEANTIVDQDSSSVAVDWELARPDGFSGVGPHLSRGERIARSGWRSPKVAQRDDEHPRRLTDLFLGRGPSSDELLRWLRATADASEWIPSFVPRW